MSNENKEEKSMSKLSISKKKINFFFSHPNFHSDFRKTPFNWVLIILSIVILIYVIITDGFIFQENDRWYFMIGIPIFIVSFIILIITQGEWQRFEEYNQKLDVAVYSGFFVVSFITIFFYDIWFSISVIILTYYFRRYLINREIRLGFALSEEKI